MFQGLDDHVQSVAPRTSHVIKCTVNASRCQPAETFGNRLFLVIKSTDTDRFQQRHLLVTTSAADYPAT